MADIFEEIVALRSRGERAALATIIARRGSTPRRDAAKMLIYDDGRTSGTMGGGCTEAEVCNAALSVIRTGRPNLLSFDLTDDDAEESGLICGGTMEYVEPVLPDPILFVFGAGHIGRCVAEAARNVGFRIAVIDDRVKYANAERFPMAESVLGPWEETLPRLPISDSSYLVIATRGHNYRPPVPEICDRHAGQVCRTSRIEEKDQAPAGHTGKGGHRSRPFLSGCTPRSVSKSVQRHPEEIAVSIVAELIAVRKNVDVKPLRLRDARG